LLVAVHVQVGREAVTLTEPEPSFAGTKSLLGEREYVQGFGVGVGGVGDGGGAGRPPLDNCVTSKRRFATLIAPVRWAPSLVETLNDSVALPLPVAGDARVIHVTSAVAAHVHSSEVAIVILPGPPLKSTCCVAGPTS
jgi:hypothetical protein